MLKMGVAVLTPFWGKSYSEELHWYGSALERAIQLIACVVFTTRVMGL